MPDSLALEWDALVICEALRRLIEISATTMVVRRLVHGVLRFHLRWSRPIHLHEAAALNWRLLLVDRHHFPVAWSEGPFELVVILLSIRNFVLLLRAQPGSSILVRAFKQLYFVAGFDLSFLVWKDAADLGFWLYPLLHWVWVLPPLLSWTLFTFLFLVRRWINGCLLVKRVLVHGLHRIQLNLKRIEYWVLNSRWRWPWQEVWHFWISPWSPCSRWVEENSVGIEASTVAW